MLPEETCTLRCFDLVVRKELLLSDRASGRFEFDSPDSQAIPFHSQEERGLTAGAESQKQMCLTLAFRSGRGYNPSKHSLDS
jgi:hypothetical protein